LIKLDENRRNGKALLEAEGEELDLERKAKLMAHLNFSGLIN